MTTKIKITAVLVFVTLLLALGVIAQSVTLTNGITQFQTTGTNLPAIRWTNANSYSVVAAIFDASNTNNLTALRTNNSIVISALGSPAASSSVITVSPGLVRRIKIPANSQGLFPAHKFHSGVVITNSGTLTGLLIQ